MPPWPAGPAASWPARRCPARSPARACARHPAAGWSFAAHARRGRGRADRRDVEPAHPHELAPLIADAYGLTGRERAVTQLVAQGLQTNAIAERLYLSPWTVQDHLKAVFEKVGVGSRGELVARVFFEHYAPRLTDGAPVGADGWFASPPGEG